MKTKDLNRYFYQLFFLDKKTFYRWLDERHLPYPHGLSLFAYGKDEADSIYDEITEYDVESYSRDFESWGTEWKPPYRTHSSYPEIKGKCLEYLKEKNEDLYNEIKDLYRISEVVGNGGNGE